jgi:hypothetical protein
MFSATLANFFDKELAAWADVVGARLGCTRPISRLKKPKNRVATT